MLSACREGAAEGWEKTNRWDELGAGATLAVLDPTADRYGGQVRAITGRLASLAGRTVGLLWNGKPMGDVALRRAAAQISDRVPDVQFRFYSGAIPCPPALLDQVAAECDAAIACPADCGSCTSWITHDAVQLERRGLPTVVIAADGFVEDLEASARAFAMPDVRHVVVPQPFNNLDQAQSEAQTDVVVDDVVAALTDPAAAAAGVTDPGEPTLVYPGPDGLDALRRFNADFLDKDWGDGFPLWPPTRAAVDALMSGITGKPSDVICLLPPGNGEATLEKIAINAAMAGCRPEEMPVVVSTVRAIGSMRPVPRAALMSTSAHAPFVLVNGPLGRELGINSGRACLGPGKQNEVGLRIGRAIVFCLKNLGSWYPGTMDMDTIGTTRKHISVVAENELESPWAPFHVSRGFAADDDAVTVFFTAGEWDISVQGHLDGRQLAKAIGSFSGGTYGTGYFTTLKGDTEYSGYGRLLLLAPPHAQPIATEGGFSKEDLAQFFVDEGREPVSRLIEPIRKLHADGKVKEKWEWLFELDAEEAERTTLPVLDRAESYSIVVVGAVRGKDLLMPTRVEPHTEPITRST